MNDFSFQSTMENQLLDYSLDQLIQLPNQLESNHQSLKNELSSLSFKQFKSFIISNQTSNSIHRSLDQLNQSLDQLIITNQSLDSHSKAFLQTNHPINQIINDRNHIRSILEHLNNFENLIELPQLISTAINHQLTNQAIDLALKLQPLSTHHHSIDLIQTINQQINRSLQLLRDQSLHQLTHPHLNLPIALRTINILRSLSTSFNPSHPQHHQISIQPISESELRLAFLTSRWQTLYENLLQLSSSSSSITTTTTTTTTIPTNLNLSQSDLLLNQLSTNSQLDQDRSKLLRRWIELWRSFVGDTLSIYHDIFLSPSSNFPYSQSSSSPQSLNDPQTPLNFFLTQALDLQTSFLQTHLASILSVSSLTSLLTQLAYCGAAFGKWGIDFTITICPLIVSRLEQLISLRIQLGLRQLSIDLKPLISPTPTSAHSLNRNGALQIRRRSLNPFPSSTHSTFVGLVNSLISPDAINRVLKLKPSQLDATRSESFITDWLSLFPPLVRFVNSQLIALNELRLLPVAGSYASIADAQFDALKAATDELRNLVHVLPESPTTHPQGHEPEDGQETEDQEKRSAYRLRLVTYRLLLLWTRNLLPTLERALRVDIYQQLDISSPQPRFLDLLDQAERLLTLIFPADHHQPQTHKANDNHQQKPSETDRPSSSEPNHYKLKDKKDLQPHHKENPEHPSVTPTPQEDTPTPQETPFTLGDPSDPNSLVKTSPKQDEPTSEELNAQAKLDQPSLDFISPKAQVVDQSISSS